MSIYATRIRKNQKKVTAGRSLPEIERGIERGLERLAKAGVFTKTQEREQIAPGKVAVWTFYVMQESASSPEIRIKTGEVFIGPEAATSTTANVISHALRVFKSDEKANSWLDHPRRQLGGKSPRESIATPEGVQRVQEILYQIEHGIFG